MLASYRVDDASAIRLARLHGPSWRVPNVRFSLEVAAEDHLLIITKEGKIIRMGVDGISRIGRATQGVRVIQLDKDDVVVSAIRAAEDDEPEAANEGAGEPQAKDDQSKEDTTQDTEDTEDRGDA